MMEATGLMPKHIIKTFKERVAKEAKRIAKKVFKDGSEAAKCRRSTLMHNADKWVARDLIKHSYSLAEMVVAWVAQGVWRHD